MMTDLVGGQVAFAHRSGLLAKLGSWGIWLAALGPGRHAHLAARIKSGVESHRFCEGSVLLRLSSGTFKIVKSGAASKKVKVQPVLVDDLPRGALPTPAELKNLHKLADKVAAGKAKIRYLDV